MVPVKFLQDKRMSHNDLKVYCAISSFQGDKGQAFPCQDKIIERSGIKQDAVTKSTKHLSECGWIEVVRRGRGLTNIYKCLTIETIPEREDKRVGNNFKKPEEIQNPEIIRNLENFQNQENIQKPDSGNNPESRIRKTSGIHIIKEQVKRTSEKNILPDEPVAPPADLAAIWSINYDRTIYQRLYNTFYYEYPKIYNEAISLSAKERGILKNIETKLKGYGDETAQLATAFKKINLLAQIARKKNKFQDWHFTPDVLSYRWNDLVDGCIRDESPPGRAAPPGKQPSQYPKFETGDFEQ